MRSLRIASPQDFCAGVLFGAFGLFAASYAAWHYKIGTAVRMGPGYFPLWVGGIVFVLGLVLALRALRVEGPALPRLEWRPLVFILGGSIAYGYALKPLGLIASTLLLVLISAAASARVSRQRNSCPPAALTITTMTVASTRPSGFSR